MQLGGVVRIVVTAVLVCLSAMAVAAAQGDRKDEAPVLTEVQRLQLEKAILVLQNTQLRLQLAQDDLSRSRLELQDVLKGLPKKDGWQFDIQKFVYVPVPTTTAAPAGDAQK